MTLFNGLPIYKCIKLDDSEDFDLISLVDEPACNNMLIKLGKEEKIDELEFKLFNEEKRIITGCSLRANYPIYRKDIKGKPGYIVFEPDEIEAFMCKFMKAGKLSNLNINHNPNSKVEGVYLIESFLLNENHKLNYKEFKELELGSWMTSYKVDNDKIWDDIKTGKINGFSPEIPVGLISLSIELSDTELLIKEIDDFITLLNK